MALTITGHYPSINATGIYRNDTIRIYFDRPIEPTTITWDTISVQDKASFTTVVGSLGAVWNTSGQVKEASFIPTTYLVSNSTYTVYVFGTPNSIIALDGTQLPNTYSFDFVTGTGYFDGSGTAGVPSGTDPTTSGVDISGINSYVESTINNFAVYTTTPANQAANQPLTTSEVTIVFTGNLLTNSSELSGFIRIVEQPVLQ